MELKQRPLAEAIMRILSGSAEHDVQLRAIETIVHAHLTAPEPETTPEQDLMRTDLTTAATRAGMASELAAAVVRVGGEPERAVALTAVNIADEILRAAGWFELRAQAAAREAEHTRAMQGTMERVGSASALADRVEKAGPWPPRPRSVS